MNNMRTYTLLALFLVPSFAAAAATLQSVLGAATGALQLFVAVGVAIALLVFIWGLVKFIAAAGDDNSIVEGKQRMVWGVVALFLIVTVWGVVALLMSLFGVGPLGADNRCDAPSIDIFGASVRTCT